MVLFDRLFAALFMVEPEASLPLGTASVAAVGSDNVTPVVAVETGAVTVSDDRSAVRTVLFATTALPVVALVRVFGTGDVEVTGEVDCCCDTSCVCGSEVLTRLAPVVGGAVAADSVPRSTGRPGTLGMPAARAPGSS